MALPNNVLSDVKFTYSWVDTFPDPSQYVDYSMGGTDIQNPIGGLRFQPWTFDTDGTSVYASSTRTGRKKILTPGGIIQSIRCCFDQNMYPFICYQISNQWNYYWFDAQTGTPVTSQLPNTVTSVACTLDDKRWQEISQSDICLFYINTNNLYYLRQRDRYSTAYLLHSSVNGALLRVGMNGINRMQIKIQSLLL